MVLPNATKAVLDAIERTAHPITRVGILVAFTLPMDDPLLSDYKARLEAGLREFIGERLIKEGRDPQALAARIMLITQPSVQEEAMRTTGIAILDTFSTVQLGIFFGRIGVTPLHPLFPTQSDGDALDALIPEEIDLAFYARPIDPTGFRPSRLRPERLESNPRNRSAEPDLGITEDYRDTGPWHIHRFTLPNRTMRRPESTYRLQTLREWTPEQSTTWRAGAIEYESDLAGAQLFIDLGERGSPLRAKFDLTGIVLQINGTDVALTMEHGTRHISQEGYPFWEFRLPSDPDLLFVTD
jgi:hypothetical protein